MSRLDEIKITAQAFGEPVMALVRSALTCRDQGRLDASARIVADLVAKRPVLKWLALLFALEATELELAGAARLGTPTKRLVATRVGFYDELWTSFIITTYPEGVQTEAQVVRVGEDLVLRSTHREQAAYDPLVKVALGALTRQLAMHFGETVSLEKSPSA